MLKHITYVHPRVADKIYKNYKQLLYKEVSRPIDLLTRREWEVLGELVKGYQNEEIAENLSISDKTVKNHITSILGKLGVRDRTKAVLLALHERWFYL
ncbi:response regulator transcription factor [Ralstonia pickettii]|nr:response regulator transcription factor [Ralstonia pickettii]